MSGHQSSPPDKVIEADVKKNDILVTFYDRDLGTDFVIVQSEDWLKALNNAKEADQKRKEEWAAKQKERGSRISLVEMHVVSHVNI